MSNMLQDPPLFCSDSESETHNLNNGDNCKQVAQPNVYNYKVKYFINRFIIVDDVIVSDYYKTIITYYILIYLLLLDKLG